MVPRNSVSLSLWNAEAFSNPGDTFCVHSFWFQDCKIRHVAPHPPLALLPRLWELLLTASRTKVVFLALILLKGFSYSLNNPCKEILYQPTNSAVKFKSKVRPQG